MKTTLEIPDPILRKAKVKAAERGIPLRQFVTAAVQEKLAATRTTSPGCKRPASFGICRLRRSAFSASSTRSLGRLNRKTGCDRRRQRTFRFCRQFTARAGGNT